MYNVEETFELKIYYFFKRDLYISAFLFAFTVNTFIDLVRGQVPEVNILQLIPGFYLFVFFLGFLFLVYFSFLFFQMPSTLDDSLIGGTKTFEKNQRKILLKFGFLLFSCQLILILNTVVPLSLECFNAYGEQTLENIWSFDEVVTLEVILLNVLVILSQTPLFLVSKLSNPGSIKKLSTSWRGITFLIILISGFLTPTIDGYTQISFAISTLSLYLVLINFSKKRILSNSSTCLILGN